LIEFVKNNGFERLTIILSGKGCYVSKPSLDPSVRSSKKDYF